MGQRVQHQGRRPPTSLSSWLLGTRVNNVVSADKRCFTLGGARPSVLQQVIFARLHWLFTSKVLAQLEARPAGTDFPCENTREDESKRKHGGPTK